MWYVQAYTQSLCFKLCSTFLHSCYQSKDNADAFRRNYVRTVMSRTRTYRPADS